MKCSHACISSKVEQCICKPGIFGNVWAFTTTYAASSDDLEPECPPVAPLEDEGDELFEECSEEEDPEADPCS